MKTESKQIHSSQTGPHHRLEEIVSKHLTHNYKKPIQDHNKRAFELFLDTLEASPYSEFVLDSCCGTGLSTRHLALSYSEALIVGIDQSAARLSRACEFSDCNVNNTLMVRANCEDFWRLCVEHGLTFKKHYLLYPNPYPKAVHFKRRWHGHPVFPYLSKLSGLMELRSNWLTYLHEFQQAWKLVERSESKLSEYKPAQYLTLFERKYHLSGQALYKLEASIQHHEL